jgi:hypothetical protein
MNSAIGTKVIRKRDGATGEIVYRELAVPSIAHPGVYGKITVSIRLDDDCLWKAAGGDMVGDLGWLKSLFKVAK